MEADDSHKVIALDAAISYFLNIMIKYPRQKKRGRFGRLKGIRLPRKKKFEPRIKTRSGVQVRSQLEKKCADFLHDNGIEFRYEPLMLLGGRQFRPDFFLPEHNLFLEICGYNHMPFYRDRLVKKKDVYRSNGLKVYFIECSKSSELDKYLRELGEFLHEDQNVIL
ncbi:MAG: hypothetical protein GF310_05050 [candidate division Zixibacteria bacterium]|nr:hypothetical protein [candidate division Zixibacteria bacterium]